MSIFYETLAAWWPLISPVEDYAEEADFFRPLLTGGKVGAFPTLLELGSGGGHNAYHLKNAFASVTLTDLFEPMLTASRALNPDCEHIQGDMRSMRLGQVFDAVFIHDAIDYMVSLDDLRAALTTAYIHCKLGGRLVVVPDAVRETFEPETEHGGADSEDGRGARYLEWSYDPDPTDQSYQTDYVFIVREDGAPSQVYHERHTLGLFALADWLTALTAVGFVQAEATLDPYERYVFTAYRPA